MGSLWAEPLSWSIGSSSESLASRTYIILYVECKTHTLSRPVHIVCIDFYEEKLFYAVFEEKFMHAHVHVAIFLLNSAQTSTIMHHSAKGVKIIGGAKYLCIRATQIQDSLFPPLR